MPRGGVKEVQKRVYKKKVLREGTGGTNFKSRGGKIVIGHGSFSERKEGRR